MARRLINFVKRIFDSLFKRKGDNVPAGVEVFDKNGNVVADVTTTLTKIVWFKVLDTFEPSISVTIPIYKNQKIFTAREFNPLSNERYTANYVAKITDDTVTFVLTNNNAIGKKCSIKLMIGVC